MRLTSPLNLPALGKRQALYVAFMASQSLVFEVNSRHPRFSATPSRSEGKLLFSLGLSLSRTYGVNLSSSLTAVISSALGCSPHQPVSVLVRAPLISLDAFPGTLSSSFGSRPRHHLWDYAADLPTASLGLVRGRLTPRLPSRIRHTIGQTIFGGTGMLTRCPSTTPFGLALGPD